MTLTIKNKYVIFKLGEEYYGLPVNNVLFIERIGRITRIPNSPKYILGLINLRGDVIPVVDLSMKLGFKSNKINDSNRIIIVKEEEIVAGLMVDSSSEVLEISQDDIDKPPVSKSNELLDYVEGIGKTKERIILILNLKKLLKHWGDGHGFMQI